MTVSAKNNAKWTAKESISKLKHSYTITVPYETFTSWANENRGSKVVKGFRQGMAPLSSFKDEWALQCAREIAQEIIEKEKLKNIFDSTYSLKHFNLGEDIQIDLNIDIYPDVPNIVFEEISLVENTAKISKDDIKKAMETWLETNHKPADLKAPRAIQMHDFLNVSIELTDPKGKTEKINTMDIQVGKKTFLPEIENALIGKSVGDTVTQPFTIPSTGTLINDPSLVGQTIQLTFKINKMQEPGKLSKQDMLTAFGVRSDEELEKKFAETLTTDAGKLSENLLKEALKQELMQFHFEIPIELVHYKYAGLRDQVLKDIGYTPDQDLTTYLKEKMDIEKDEFEKRTIILAEAMARLSFLINHFANTMKISVSNLELDDAIAEHKKMFPNGLQDAVQFFEENKDAKQNLLNNLLEDKVLKTLLTKCKVSKKEHSSEDFYSLKFMMPDDQAENKTKTKAVEAKAETKPKAEKKVENTKKSPVKSKDKTQG